MRRRILLTLLLGVAGIYLALNLRTFVRDTIVVPSAYAYFILGRVLASLHQPTVWALFLAAAVFAALASLVRFQRRGTRQEQEASAYEGRIETFAHWLQMKSSSPYFNLRLARYLSELSLDVLAHAEGLEREAAARRLFAADSEVPMEIQQYLQAAYLTGVRRRRGFSWALRRSEPPPEALDMPLERLLDYLEGQMRR